MSRLEAHEIEHLTQALHDHDPLTRMLGEIGELQRVVFHGNARADWSLVRRSAEQILIAEIVYRHQGRPDGLLEALRAACDGHRSWDSAIRELASAIHSYYTTPLGMVMRQDLFGANTVFITPDAYDWTAQLKGSAPPGDDGP